MNTTMELHDFLRSRRSVRRFDPEPLGDEVVERMLTTAGSASSAHNRQPWRYAVVATDAARTRLAATMADAFRRDLEDDGTPAEKIQALVDRSLARIQSAPLAVVLCMDSTEMDVYPDARRAGAEHTMAVQSTANAGTTLLLAAHAEGLGAVWNCGPLFAPEAVVSALDLPATWKPQALILIGKPAQPPPARARKAVIALSKFL
jgi:coenzyme F420-0:L-glutamate ligase/coenzyme F420-1:gamma-L-glutamate ligase